MISLSLLALLGLVGVLIAALVGVLVYIFLLLYKRGVDTKDQTPS